jgi:hypothetical protein
LCWYEALYKNGALTCEFVCSLDLTTYCVHFARRPGHHISFSLSLTTLFLNAADTKTWAALKFDQPSDQQLAIYREHGTGIWTYWKGATALALRDLRGSKTSDWVGALDLAQVLDGWGQSLWTSQSRWAGVVCNTRKQDRVAEHRAGGPYVRVLFPSLFAQS